MKKNFRRICSMAFCLVVCVFTFTSCADDGSTSNTGNYSNSDNYLYEDNEQNYKYSINAENNQDMTDEAEIQAEIPNDEEYNSIIENQFESAAKSPLSTFSTDVDTASFSNVRRMIESKMGIDPDAVRTEEFINYLKYDYDMPQGDEKIAISTELSDCPWNEDAQLLLIGLQAAQAPTQEIDSNIVFLIDISGSMDEPDKLPLVKQAFSMLAENLGENDKVSIVTYAGDDHIALKGCSGDNFDEICTCLNNLSAGGSTAGADGINTAYELAQQYFIEGGNNRVILATDGDLNVGLSSEQELTELIEEKRESGVFLSVLGFGTGNLKDNKLEALADNGNGNYAYINSVDEAKRVLVSELNGTLFTVAKDAKVQVEFNPQNVESYRLVGYENRVMANEDFENDAKDAGDIGSGQQVTALYEIIPSKNDSSSQKTLKYQQDESEQTQETSSTQTNDSSLNNELLTISVRYKNSDEDESKLIDKAVMVDSYVSEDEISDNFALAQAAAMFAKALRNSSDTNISMSQIKDKLSNITLESRDDLLTVVNKYEDNYSNF